MGTSSEVIASSTELCSSFSISLHVQVASKVPGTQGHVYKAWDQGKPIYFAVREPERHPRSSRWDLLGSNGNSPVDNAGMYEVLFTGPVQVCAPQSRRRSSVTRRFPMEITTIIERSLEYLISAPAFPYTLGFYEFRYPFPSCLHRRSLISVLSSYQSVCRQAIRPGSFARSSSWCSTQGHPPRRSAIVLQACCPIFRK